jgi:hypothetical protein
LFAFALLVLFAFAALAIDAGLAHNERRALQNAADSAAMSAALASCEGRNPVTAGLAAAAANGYSNSAETYVGIFAITDGSFRATIDNSIDPEFATTFGSSDIELGATAVAACVETGTGLGALPFGAPPSGFHGGLQAPNPCGANSGNCGRLFIYRLGGIGETGEDTRNNIAYGADRILTPWESGHDLVYCSLTEGLECNVVESNTGVSSGQLGDGFLERLSDTEGSSQVFTFQGSEYDADTLDQVLGFEPKSLADHGKPDAWDEGIHGPWDTADIDDHYWVDGPIDKCDSPRLGSVVIVTGDLDYDPAGGDPYPPPWPNGSKPMKVLGDYIVYIADPDEASDFNGSGSLKRASSYVLWLSEATKCIDGTAIGVAGTVATGAAVSLEE